ncbi:MAG TPA: tetratricopeptide repeat protein [Lacibacter sp.]|nr:tetratricopeptide repeat protein [Lacibacter sp.]
MRRVFILTLFNFVYVHTFAQSEATSTYAVVIGISNYANKGITKLQYAHNDAIAFADYLKSAAGGAVPEENIRLLIDKEATTASVYESLSWLLSVSRQNDVVYFYFAGHGDMEHQTMYKLGFLLTYNTPRTNYINNAVRIEDLNNFANTLSTRNKARVILITDACHSGTLAGNDYRGNYLVGEQLRTRKANEIRITSCGPDELAMEHEGWGGGRGVFSFYFINGLIGFADKERDGVVRIKDMKEYLDSAFAHDSLLIIEKHKQSPIIAGNAQAQLAKVDVVQMNRIAEQRQQIVVLAAPVVAPAARELIADEIVEKLFQDLYTRKLDTIFDFQQLNLLPTSAIATSFLNRYQSLFINDTFSLERGIYFTAKETIKELNLVLQQLKSDTDFRAAFERKMVVFIHDKGQEVLNAYLDGDVAELEKRRYYNASNNSFDSYPAMFAVARKLLPPDDYLSKILEVNEYYFGGIALVTKMPLTKNPSGLIEQAMKLERKALALEKEAPYIYNALGSLHFYKGEYTEAAINYQKATELAPQWALPWSNLQALYTTIQSFTKAETAFNKAKELKPDLSDVYVNNGLLQEQKQQYLFAEEQYRKGIFYNSRHYLPFERLAVVYNRTGDYSLADSFYYEADLRKRGYHFSPKPNIVVALPVLPTFTLSPICNFDSSNINEQDVYAYFLWGFFHYKMGAFAAAEEKWKHVIQLDPRNPLAFHYLGVMQWQQKRFLELDIMLQYAVRNYLPENELKRYADSLRKLSSKESFSSCVEISFEAAVYIREEDHYYLGNAYEQWNHFEEAEHQYRLLMKMNPSFIGAYILLWQMLERVGRYDEAEQVILDYKLHDEAQANNELAAFYKRVSNLFPDVGYWHLKAGDFFYVLAKKDAPVYVADRKSIFPDETEPAYVDSRVGETARSKAPEKIPGTDQTVYPAMPVIKPMTEGIRYLLIADSLLGHADALNASINDKIGDLYTWQGVPLYASVHYQKSIDLLPVNTSVRLKLVDACNTVFKYTAALEHLDTLKNRKEINFEKQLLLAKYYMHNSRFTEAEQLLAEARTSHPYKIPELFALYARLYMLSNQPQKAIEWLEEYLVLRPGESEVMYSISRMYAQLNKSNKAMEWLGKALKNGFAYEWVLQRDPLLQKLRSTPLWNVWMKKQSFKKYPAPVNSYPRSTP